MAKKDSTSTKAEGSSQRMKIEKVHISKVHLNDENPRIIKDDKFKKLVKSIQDFPQMLEIRPIVVDEGMMILGGNMRYQACKDAGMEYIYIIRAENLTSEQKREFVIKDNASFGEWDWDVLANEWESQELNDWGIDVWRHEEGMSLEDVFEEHESTPKEKEEEKEDTYEIKATFTSKEDYMKAVSNLDKQKSSLEEILLNMSIE